MAAFKKALGDKTGTNTFPNLFIKGKSYGGCNAIKQLEHTGEFKILIASYLGRAIPEPAKISSTGFLWFPEVVNRHVMRLTSLLSFIMAVVIVGTHFYPGAKWAALALALDYVLRFCFGGAYSVGGTIASAILANYPAAFFAGPPKQFAAFCGLFMTTFSAALFISGEEVGGAVVMAGLAVSTLQSSYNLFRMIAT